MKKKIEKRIIKPDAYIELAATTMVDIRYAHNKATKGALEPLEALSKLGKILDEYDNSKVHL